MAWLDASPDDQQAARALLVEGRRLFEQWLLVEAEDRYRAALARWRHPIIYLYLSQVRAKRGDLVGAYENLQQALRHEPAPFSAEERRLAGVLTDELESRLASIEVRCDQTGAEVWLDGELWFEGPGQPQRVVRPGQHLIVAREPGFVPATRMVSLKPGTQARVALCMSSSDSGGGQLPERNTESATAVTASQAPSLDGERLRTRLAVTTWAASQASSPAAIRPPRPLPGDARSAGRRQGQGTRRSRAPLIGGIIGVRDTAGMTVAQPFGGGLDPETAARDPFSPPAFPVTPGEPWLPAGLGSSPGFGPQSLEEPIWIPTPPDDIPQVPSPGAGSDSARERRPPVRPPLPGP